MTTTDIDNMEGLELRRRTLAVLGWSEFDDDEDDPWAVHPTLGRQPEPPVESSLDAFNDHAVPFIEERGWERSEGEYVEPDYVLRYGTVAGESATGPRTTHPATLLCRALLKAAEAQG